MRDRNAPLTSACLGELAWEKMGGLLPAIVQDRCSGRALMLGYMDQEALDKTLSSGLVTFFSRSKQRLWQKGELSGHLLEVQSVTSDCDGDALLVVAEPHGPTCHKGTASCFGEVANGAGWLADLSRIVAGRAGSGDETSYTQRLIAMGVDRIAQKVGEEGVELALAAVTRDDRGCVEEAADLIYHATVLLHARGLSWNDVVEVLHERHSKPVPDA